MGGRVFKEEETAHARAKRLRGVCLAALRTLEEEEALPSWAEDFGYRLGAEGDTEGRGGGSKLGRSMLRLVLLGHSLGPTWEGWGYRPSVCVPSPKST